MVRVAVAGDLHVGSTVALSPKRWVMGDENIHVASPKQMVILELWNRKWGRVFEDSMDVISVINGDLVEGGRRGQVETWAPRMKDQMDAVVELLLPIATRSKQTIITRGTPFHVQDGGNVEDVIAKELGAKGMKAHKRVRLTIEEVTIEFVHKGPKFGSRAWTWSNNVRNQVLSNATRDIMLGKKPVDLYVYSHYHRVADSGPVVIDLPGGIQYTTRGIICPSWKLIDEWTNHTDAPLADIGLLVLDIDGKNLTIRKDYESFDPTEGMVYDVGPDPRGA